MARRLEVELTSSRDDGSWTWRAAGARQPKGVMAGSVLYDGAQVGDVVKAEAEFHLDGIEIIEVFAPKAKKERTNILEMKPRELRDDELVTTQRSKRGGRGDRSNKKGDRQRSRRGRPDGNRSSSPSTPQRPKPKRLRPKRVHRDKLLADTTEAHHPILEQLFRDGLPGVRKEIDKQAAEAKEAGKTPQDAAPILAIAEDNVAKVRLAEWKDKADAALADSEQLDLRDLRSVVVSGADIARDDESRELSERVKAALDGRVDSDHLAWLADLEAALSQNRVVRALRLSSRPVKAGAPLPAEMATTLTAQASAALASDVTQDRWATVLDALAFSPVRAAVTPEGIPAEPAEQLLDEVRRLSDRIPAIAELFGIDPTKVPNSAKKRRSRRKKPASGKNKPKRSASKTEGKPETPAATQPAPEATEPEAPATEPAAAEPEAPAAEPAAAEPEAPATEPEAAEPEAAEPEAPATEPEAPATEPEAPATEPEAPATEPAEPEAKTETPAHGEPLRTPAPPER